MSIQKVAGKSTYRPIPLRTAYTGHGETTRVIHAAGRSLLGAGGCLTGQTLYDVSHRAIAHSSQ
jgi:hypothetical protein